MPSTQAPSEELGSAPETLSLGPSPSPSDVSSTTSSSSDPVMNIRAPALFRLLAMPPPEPEQPPGQDELERRLPGYRRIVIPRDLTLIEHLKQSSGVETDDEILSIREAKLQVIAERVGLRRLNILAPRLRNLTLDGSGISTLRDLGIGMNRLKVLSINRCNLSSLDGIWGLHSLRELYAAKNKISDLQPLAVLQKLHTLDLAHNPITPQSRLWTIAICNSLRRLTLEGTPLSTTSTYRSDIAETLPMLIYLDDRTMHNDIDYDTDNIVGEMSSSSDSEEDPAYEKALKTEIQSKVPTEEPQPGTSNSRDFVTDIPDKEAESGTGEASAMTPRLRRRPATTETAGPRPDRPQLRPRPHTAHGTTNKPLMDKLHIMNTLMDDEWRSSGSSLTSHEPVCGNLAQALRRPNPLRQKAKIEQQAKHASCEEILCGAIRGMAHEIPKAPSFEDWAKFREETGIDINIDFSNRPPDIDPNIAIDRLERIEMETMERFKNENLNKNEDLNRFG